jgi:hypothetical protein
MSLNPFADQSQSTPVAASGADTIQDLLTTGGTQSVLAWNSIVTIPAQTANLSIVLPTTSGNLGKKITFICVGTDAFTRTLSAFGAETVINQSGLIELTTLNGSTTFEVTNSTTSRQISTLGASGDTLTDTVTQAAHGFFFGQAINRTLVGTWVAADITSATKTADAIVSFVVDVNTFKFTTEGTLIFNATTVDAVTASATDRQAAGQFKVGEYYHFNNLGKWTVTAGAIYSQVIAKALTATTARIFLTKPEATSTSPAAVRFQRFASVAAGNYPTVAGVSGALTTRYDTDSTVGLSSGSAFSWNSVNKSLVYDGTSSGRYRIEFDAGVFNGGTDISLYQWFDVSSATLIGVIGGSFSATSATMRNGNSIAFLEVDLTSTPKEWAACLINSATLPIPSGVNVGHRIKVEKIAAFLPFTASSSPIFRSFTYGTALTARQPVYMQTDGKVYPIFNSSVLSTGPADLFSLANTLGVNVTATNAVANRFVETSVLTDASLRWAFVDYNFNTGAFTAIGTGNLPNTLTVPLNTGQFFCVNRTGTIGLLLHEDSPGLKLTGVNMTVTTLSSYRGASNTVYTTPNTACPSAVNTPNSNKFVFCSRRGSDHGLSFADTTAASPTFTLLATTAIYVAFARSTMVVKLDGLDKYVWINSTPTTATLQPFTFNSTTNAFANLGAGSGAITQVGIGNLSADLVYLDAANAWVALHRNGDPNKISMHQINLTTGLVTSYAPQVFTPDTILAAQSTRTLVSGHKPGIGKFLVSYYTSATQMRIIEVALDILTGLLSTSIAPINSFVSASATNTVASHGANTLGVNFAVRIDNNTTENYIVPFGTFTTVAPVGSLVGITQNSGAINSSGAVDLVSSVASGFVGLSPGGILYADYAGNVSANPTSGVKVGRALSATELQIQYI